MELYQKFLGMAKQLGIPQESLSTWCEEKVQQEMQIQEKKIAYEREEKAEERRLAQEKEAQQKEREEREMERQKEKEDREREERAHERQVKRELALAEEETKRQQIAMEATMRQTSAPSQPKSDDFLMKLPRMPVFNQEADCLESFLHRFEMQAQGYGWPKEKWSSALINCLSGEPLKVFYTLASEDANDYEKIKEALLKRFRLTEDGYQEKFFTAAPLKTEDFNTYLNRTTQFFNKWIQLAGIKEGDFKGLSYLILKNRIFQACNPELVAFLKERKPLSVEDLKNHAENYQSAHPHSPLSRITKEPYYAGAAQMTSKGKPEFHGRRDGSPPRGPQNRRHDNKHWDDQRAQPRKHDLNSDDRRYQPRRPDDNWLRGNLNDATTRRNLYDDRKQAKDVNLHHKRDDYGRPHDKPKCKYCSKLGHEAKDCYKLFGHPTHKACMAVEIKPNKTESQDTKSEGKKTTLVAGLSAITMSSDGRPETESIPLCVGKVNGIKCSTTRDTGCTTVGIKETLITDKDRTGNVFECITFNGDIHTYDEAKVHIATPYFTGCVRCCILKNPPTAELIIGNIIGVEDNPESSIPWTPSEQESRYRDKERKIKGRNDKENPLNPLLTPNFNHDEYMKRQQDDASLKKYFYYAKKNDGTNSKVKYNFNYGLLYREITKGSNSRRQLMVPTCYREKILANEHEANPAKHTTISSMIKRISMNYTWPGIVEDIRQVVKSCDACQKKFHERKMNKFEIGEEVLVLLPGTKWKGPFKVTAVGSDDNYDVQMGKVNKTFHIDRLKKYFSRNKLNPNVTNIQSSNESLNSTSKEGAFYYPREITHYRDRQTDSNRVSYNERQDYFVT